MHASHTYMHCIHTHTHMHTYTHMHTCTHACTHACTHTRTQVRLETDDESGAGVLVVSGSAAQLDRAHDLVKMVVSSDETALLGLLSDESRRGDIPGALASVSRKVLSCYTVEMNSFDVGRCACCVQCDRRTKGVTSHHKRPKSPPMLAVEQLSSSTRGRLFRPSRSSCPKRNWKWIAQRSEA